MHLLRLRRKPTICKHIHLVAATYAMHISQQDLVEQDPQLIQTDEPPHKDVVWETVVNSLGNDSIQHDVEAVRRKCQDYLIDISSLVPDPLAPSCPVPVKHDNT